MKNLCKSLPWRRGYLCLFSILGLACFLFVSISISCADSADGNTCVEGLLPDCRGVCGGDASIDSCGICNGPGLNAEGCCGDAVRDCEGICGGSATELQCGCNIPPNADGCCGDERDYGCGCGVPESECEKECLFIASHSPFSNWSDEYIDSFGVTRSQDVPLCFSSYFGNKCSKGARGVGTLLYGGCNMGSPKKILSWVNLGQFLGVPQDVIHNPYDGFNHIYDRVEWYMDENCRYVANRGKREICGFGGVSQSPISLAFADLTELEQGMTVVSFPLDARMKEQYTLWKASEKFPLLVYDPDKTGDVSSAKQLFGNYTYGGYTKTALDYRDSGTRTEWEHGFEALGLLDVDDDGIVSGEELEHLSLWYDRNRNARVDAGELKSVQREGIQELYYKDPQSLPGRKDLIQRIGYSRMVNGAIVQGESIDWYSDVYSSMDEAAQALSASFRARYVHMPALEAFSSGYLPAVDNDREKPYVSWPNEPLSFTPHVSKNHSRDLSGYWLWQLEGTKKEQKNPSVFALEHDQTGGVLGYSVLELPLAENAGKIRSGIRAVPLKGKVRQQGGNVVFHFETRDEKSGALASNTAELSRDGMLLSGTTRQRYTGSRDGEETSAYMTYSWKAMRVTLQ